MSHATHTLLESIERQIDLTSSERHELLEADRRRYVLAVLSDRREPLDLTDLAVAVAQREPGVAEDDPDDVQALATTLHHIHLPKLAEAGIVDYEPDTNRILP